MTSQTALDDRLFTMQFTSSARGVRLARHLVGERLAAWGHPRGSEPHDALALLASELCTNAVRHGRVPGRGFRVTLTATRGALRIAVTDARAERRPVPPTWPPLGEPAERGRGLLLVDAVATRWGVTFRDRCPGKTVWAEYVMPAAQAVP